MYWYIVSYTSIQPIRFRGDPNVSTYSLLPLSFNTVILKQLKRSQEEFAFQLCTYTNQALTLPERVRMCNIHA